MNLYNDYKAEFYLREISRSANLPIKTTQNVLQFMENKNILKSSMHGKNRYFTLNTDNIQTKFLILQAEIHKTQLFLDKYPLLKPFVKNVATQALIIVFGSFARFAANKDSDLDLAIIGDHKLPTHLSPYKVHEVKISERALQTKETLIEEIKANHIILNNHSLYVNMMWAYGQT